MTDVEAWIKERRRIHAKAQEHPHIDPSAEWAAEATRARWEYENDAKVMLPKALDALERVMEAHRPMPDGNCATCTWFSAQIIVEHPCATVQAIEGVIHEQ